VTGDALVSRFHFVADHRHAFEVKCVRGRRDRTFIVLPPRGLPVALRYNAKRRHSHYHHVSPANVRKDSHTRYAARSRLTPNPVLSRWDRGSSEVLAVATASTIFALSIRSSHCRMVAVTRQAWLNGLRVYGFT
jgi:hypothetical protein